jgi:hypothetical protein
LARESLGEAVTFPFPSHFSHKDYEKLNRANMGIKPRVVVANPPFAEDGNIQRAAKFIERFKLVGRRCPICFCPASIFFDKHNSWCPDARGLLTERCRIFEVWQCPAGTVGIDASQDVCVVLGSVSQPQITLPTTARAIFSQVRIPDTRENGFLGSTWISQIRF